MAWAASNMVRLPDGRETPAPVAYLMSRFPRLTETFILREILELERRGQPVMVFPLLSVRQEIHHPEADALARRVHYTPFCSHEVIAANLHYLRQKPKSYLKALWQVVRGNLSSPHLWLRGLALFPKSVCIARRIQATGARHIHAHFATHPALAALVISELTGIGYSFTAHAHDIFVHTIMLPRKIERARFVVTISEFNKDHLLSLAPGTPSSKIHVVRCGVDPVGYSRLQTPAEERPAGLRLLCVASLEPYKGIEYLIRACQHLRGSVPDFCCHIIGAGSQHNRLAGLIGELKLEQNVRLLGPRTQGEVARELGRADIFVLPSIVASDGQMEGIPVALMEAMATGVPVVASRLSGIPELVESGLHGFLVPPGDHEALSQALAALCCQEELRKRMGRQAREKVSADFSLNENVARLLTLFRKAAPELLPCDENEALPSGQDDTLRRLLLSGNPGRDSDGIGVRVLHQGPDRDSVVSEVSWQGTSFILKRHQSSQSMSRAEHCARREHDALLMLAGRLPQYSSFFRVPRVIAFSPERCALLMERCSGETFEAQLRWAALRPGSSFVLQQAAIRCGEWLGIFHRATCTTSGDGIEEEIQDSFFHDLETCAALGLERCFVSSALDAFRRGSPDTFDKSDWTGHHGDFGPHNVFLSEQCTSAIDFEGFRIGHAGEDLADFLVLLELMPGYHIDAELCRDLQASFLDGYQRQRPYPAPAMDLFRLQALVKRMAHNPSLQPRAAAARLWKKNLLIRSYQRCLEPILS